uniref:Uncharacterized protein n=1 Tax=Aegilops tauschii TaxID=37682 RepID=M8BW94_AEGTA
MGKHIKHNAQLFVLLSMVLLSCLVSSAVQGQSIADKGSNTAAIRPNDDPDCEKEKLQWP